MTAEDDRRQLADWFNGVDTVEAATTPAQRAVIIVSCLVVLVAVTVAGWWAIH